MRQGSLPSERGTLISAQFDFGSFFTFLSDSAERAAKDVVAADKPIAIFRLSLELDKNFRDGSYLDAE
jgi:hypothetical protein